MGMFGVRGRHPATPDRGRRRSRNRWPSRRLPDPVRRLAGLAVCLAPLCLAPASVALSQPVSISEFLASNGEGLEDEDRDRSDWIEVHNSGRAAVDLAGWSLTDDVRLPRKWEFPSIPLEPGGYLLVFASGKDRRVAGAELHASFRLDGDGEYLALVMPDGITAASRFAPVFPPQREDISYGLVQEVSAAELVGPDAAVRLLVPTDGSADPAWILPGFDDSGWSPGTPRLGYDTETGEGPPPGEAVNLARLGTATQSTTGYGGDASRAIDGNTDGAYGGNSVTHTVQGDPSPWWQVDLGEDLALDRIVLWNRTDCCSRRLSNFRIVVLDGARNEVWTDFFFVDGFDAPTPGVGFEVPLPAGTVGRVVRIEVLGPNADGELYLSLAEVEVLEGVRGYRHLIATDLEGPMRGVGSSAYVRARFRVDDPAALDRLTLRIRYDDGFVAWLNGSEVLRRNAPAGALAWTDRAAADRPDADAVLIEEIHLSGWISRLVPGDNLLAIQGLNSRPDDDDFLVSFELESASVREGELRYLPEPTPGRENGSPGLVGFVDAPVFSVDRGFHEAPFSVAISSPTPGARIRYTLDGSAPSETEGLLHAAPIRVESTSVLRAIAYLEGWGSAPVVTQTYLFPAQVVRQTGAGFPASWGGTAADYEMDPNVVQAPAYRDTIVDDLQTLPTLCLTLDVEDLFGPSGLYSNTEGRGDAWERPCSMELFYPPGSTIRAEGLESWQANCGLRIFGFGWRSHSASLKHAFRLMFKREYGSPKLRFPFFPGWPTERFDDIVLRSQGSRGWNDFRVSIEGTQYIHDAWARYTARDMGKLTTSSTYVHLYLNGLYWGLYNPVERPDAEFLAEHLGGNEEDYDALNARVGQIEVIDGSRAGWDALMTLSLSAADPAKYLEIQERLDVVDLSDYMIIQFYTGNQDWPGSNGNNMRVAGGPGELGGYRSFCWDMEYSFWNAGDNILNVNTSYSSPATLWSRLKANPEYRVLFGDRVRRHLLGDGALSPAKAAARWMDRAREIDRAVVGESARWGDRRREPPYTRDVEWIREQRRLLDSYFPQRSGILVTQLRQAGMYPAIDAPELSRSSGPILPGFRLRMSAPAGAILFTLDGTDPRLPGGAVSPAALSFGGEVETTSLLAAGAPARVLVPRDGSLGQTWVLPSFDDSAWLAGRSGVGFDTGTGYEDLIATDVETAMVGVTSSVYVRVPFVLPAGLFDGGGRPTFAGLFLDVQYDDGFVAWLNGELVESRNAPAAPAWDSRATAAHADSAAVEFERVDIGASVDLLRPGANLLAIQGLNTSASGGDLLLHPKLEAASETGAVVLEASARVLARARLGDSWSALSEALYWVDTPLRVTELMYHPPDPADPGEGDPEDFEFIELRNVGTDAIALAGLRLSGGIRFDFAVGAIQRLDPGRFVVVVKDLDAFAARYGTAGIPIAGIYDGNLGNGGERLRLEGPLGEAILDFRYEDSWFPETDGGGRSLVCADPLQGADAWSRAAGWRPGAVVLGTPGRDDAGDVAGWQIPGDINRDAELNLSDAIALLGYLFLGTGQALPCGEGALTDGSNRSLLDSNGDGSVDLTDAIYVLGYLFLGGPAPALGTACVPIPGCPDICGP